uniref:CMP/dCMP-type deaminase domain-containing protein n=1 Tax=Onchocerca volvulus TaxID=6282 RepID=A0A8R1TXQ1_ONCVO
MTYKNEEPSCSGCWNEQEDARKKMKERRFTIVPVLRNEIISEELPLIEYHAINVKDKSKIGLLLQILPNMPSGTNHLKRIKNGIILVQPADDPLLQEFVKKLQTTLSDISLLRVKVPLCKPVTRRQYLWAKQHWPTAFHPNKEYEALLNGSFFTVDEYQKIIGFYLESEKIGNGGSGCVIVDLKGEIVAKSGSRNIPLGHAVMAAVSDLCEKHRIKESDVLQYLGTGYDVYMTDEACAMCAMALVHFRVGRVFYGKRNPSNGVYESCWRIQEEKSLNHHYAVFRIDELI